MRFLAAPLLLALATTASALSPVDIGSPSIIGSASFHNGEWDVVAGGKDIWGTSDEFTYLCEQRTGNFDVVVHLEGITPTQLYTRMGLMARSSMSARSAHVYLAAFADNQARHNNNGGIELQYRNSEGGPSAAIYPPGGALASSSLVFYPHTWLRLKRTGNVFAGYVSQDGTLWMLYGSVTLPLEGTCYVGVAVTSHDPNKACDARFLEFRDMPVIQTMPGVP